MENLIQYGALGLLGFIIASVIPIARAVARAHLDAVDRLVETQKELALQIIELANRIDKSEAACLTRTDTMERAIQANVNETRHSLKNDATALGATAITEIREGNGRVLGAVELVRQRVSGLYSATKPESG